MHSVNESNITPLYFRRYNIGGTQILLLAWCTAPEPHVTITSTSGRVAENVNNEIK
jgi:nucleoside-diphosphate-sugar epimerase